MTHTETRQQLRSFGLLVGGIFGLIGLWPMVWRHQSPRLWAVALAVLLIVPGLVAPRILAPAYRAVDEAGRGAGLDQHAHSARGWCSTASSRRSDW